MRISWVNENAKMKLWCTEFWSDVYHLAFACIVLCFKIRRNYRLYELRNLIKNPSTFMHSDTKGVGVAKNFIQHFNTTIFH